MQQLRYALRQLRRSPGFALTAIITLALGIGASTAIFTLIYQVMLRELPVRQPGQLYKLGATHDCCYNNGGLYDDWGLFSYDQYKNFEKQLTAFSSMAAAEGGENSVGVRSSGNEAAVPAQLQFVSGNYFSTLGVNAFAGRVLEPADDRRGEQPHVVLSYSYWQRHFGGAPGTVGSTVMVNNRAMTVAGILPAGFYGLSASSHTPDLWVPLAFEPMLTNIAAMNDPGEYWLYLVGRADAGTKPADLDAQTSGILQNWLQAHPDTLSASQMVAIARQRTEWIPAATGVSELRNTYASGLRLLLLIAGFVLLIICANLANLMLVRGMARRQQTAVRLALGASRGRLVRQSLLECLLLAILGGAVALVLSVWGTRAMLALVLHDASHAPISAAVSWPVFGFALAVAVMAALLFGCVPAWITSHLDPVESLRGASRTAGDATAWPQKALVVLQAALSLALLSTAGLLTMSLRALEHQNLHLETTGRLVIGIDPVAAGYRMDRIPEMERAFDTMLRNTPGVLDLGYATFSPLSHNGWHDLVRLPGEPPPPPVFTNNPYRLTFDAVSPGYFAAVGTHVLLGRGIADSDTATTQRIAVVNEAFVKHFLKGKPPLGMHFGMDPRDPAEFQIVGVVDDTKYEDPDEPQLPMAFFSMAQRPEIFRPEELEGSERVLYPRDIVVHYRGSEAEMAEALRKQMAAMDPNLPITRIEPMAEQVGSNFTEPELLARLTGAFGVLALLLAAIGIYGVTAYSVEQRTREIGLRMALGADRGDVLRGVLRRALGQVAVGLALGVPLALALGHLVSAHLYGVGSSDPVVLGYALVTLLAAAALAALIPARRASSIEPVEALRNE